MKRPAFVSAFAALLTALPPAAAETYAIDPSHTFPSFEIGHFGFSVQRGRFNKTQGKVTMDRAAGTGTVDVTIDTASIDTGHEKLEAHLRAEDFFDVAKHPTITFKGTGFVFDGDRMKSVAGVLTMLGNSRPVTLDATAFNCGPHPVNKKPVCGGEFVAKIKRSDWGMTKFVPAVTDEVTLRINVEARQD